MDALLKFKTRRKLYMILYFIISSFLTLLFGEVTLATVCIFFPWAAAVYFLVFRIMSTDWILFGGAIKLTIAGINFWATLLFLSLVFFSCLVLYMKSITLINARMSKKFRGRFPYVTMGYYTTGVIVAFLLKIPYVWEIYWKISWGYFVYPALIFIGVLYPFLDWRLAKKIAILEENNLSQVAQV